VIEAISPIILIGPTTVGKTDIAKALVDSTDGHLINSDRHYFYAGETFSLGLGLEHGELEDGRQRHLYGGLGPNDAPPTPEEYIEQVAIEVDAIHSLGGVAVLEGCTRRYAMSLMDYFGIEHAVSITWDSRKGLDAMVRKRLAALSQAGLYEETEYAMNLGYEHTFPMSALMYRVASKVVRNELTLVEAEDRMVKEWIDIATAHDDIYAGIPNLARIEHDRSQTNAVAESIVSALQASHKLRTSVA
jgi:tRNA A37 N6-isopentenylltransferase MiaA